MFLALAVIVLTPVCGNASPGLLQGQETGRELSEAQPMVLDDLINEALANNPQLAAYGFFVTARQDRIPQEKSLPDPVFSFGYQNEGWDRYSFGESLMSQWMFAASQTFPYPGKLGLKGEIARQDALSMRESYEDLRLRIALQVKELFFDLLLNYKELDIIAQRYSLFTELEKAALARYSSGLASQEEVILAQTEKYTLLETKEELRQKIFAARAKLNSLTGGVSSKNPFGRPAETGYLINSPSSGLLVGVAISNSPQIRMQQRLVGEAQAAVRLAEKQYYPDFTVRGEVDKKAGEFMDMWSLTTAVNVPLYYKTKQREGVREAKALLQKAQADLDAAKLSVSSDIESSFSLSQMAEHHMRLYKEGLIPKTYQDFEAALSGYVAGNVTAFTAIDRLKRLLDYEFKYWRQFVEKQKAIAGIEALTGKTIYITEGSQKMEVQ
ncbi:MAG: TolC family protein [Nitrospiraceae bacterium]|nr:TolC family protein [Nitrospiraceae bacterium]